MSHRHAGVQAMTAVILLGLVLAGLSALLLEVEALWTYDYIVITLIAVAFMALFSYLAVATANRFSVSTVRSPILIVGC